MSAKPKWVTMVLSAVVASAVLGACSSPPAGTSSPTVTTAGSANPDSAAVHNDADTAFAQMMIVHHQGAIEMADLAATQAERAQVRALAERISAAQGPEIETMSSWLSAWGEDPMPADSDMTGMDHSGMDMDGMSQEEAMNALRGLSGDAFDREFLTLMIAHHEGAIEMAKAQLADGRNPQALELAQKIIADQEAEIQEMQGLLASA